MASQRIKVYLGPGSILSGYGLGERIALEGIKAGRSALRQKTAHGTEADAVFYAQSVSESDIAHSPGLTRLENMVATVVEDVVRQSGLDLSAGDVMMVLSSTKGNVGLLGGGKDGDVCEEAYMTCFAGRVAGRFGLRQSPVVVCNACISGVAAAIVASRLIRSGACRHALVVGADELTDFVTSGFLGFRSVSPHPCLPYDARRDGLSLGEAAGCLLLTSEERLSRGVCVEGGALSDDANHISGPSRTGEPLAAAIRSAMAQTGLTAADISMVNAHGTATVYNDEMESKAMGLAGLNTTPLNSLKPYLGHTLGASGLVELMLCAEELKEGVALPTLGFSEPGTPVALSVSAEAQRTRGERCLKTASGFGGCNAAVVLARQDLAVGVGAPAEPRMRSVRSVLCRDGRLTTSDGLTFAREGAAFGEFIRDAYHELCQPNMKFFKMDDLCRLGYVGAEVLLRDVGHEPEGTAILLANRVSSLDTDVAYQKMMEAGEANPGKFVYTLPNIVIGEICIRHQIRGESLFVVMDDYTPERLRTEASRLLDLGGVGTLVCGWVDLLDEKYELYLEVLKKI